MYKISLLLMIIVLSYTGCGSSKKTTKNFEKKIRIVSTPNPSLFPMLVALAQNPNLPVEIIPVSGSSTIDSNLSAGIGDGLLSMTYVSAKKSTTGSIPQMKLKSVNYFSGYMLLTRTSDGITNINELIGKNILISGPVGSGENGGPDIFFQAYLAEQNLSTTDFKMFYLPLNDGVAAVMNQTPLDDGDGNTLNDKPADAYLLVEPAATGMAMNTNASGIEAYEISINLQNGFPSFSSWSNEQLPLGGFSLVKDFNDNVNNSEIIDLVVEKYNEGAKAIMEAYTIQDQREYANIISNGIHTYYSKYDLTVPVPVIVAALNNINGGLVYKHNVDINEIYIDFNNVLESIVNNDIDEDFYTLSGN